MDRLARTSPLTRVLLYAETVCDVEDMATLGVRSVALRAEADGLIRRSTRQGRDTFQLTATGRKLLHA